VLSFPVKDAYWPLASNTCQFARSQVLLEPEGPNRPALTPQIWDLRWLSRAEAAKEQERVQKRRLQDASLALGVPVGALESDETLIPRLLEYSSQRFSGELLRNRFSDLCGMLRTGWGWLGSLIQVGIVLGVAWTMYNEGAQNAVYMWSVLAVAVFFWVVSVALAFSCLLLTGRYPGEANMARKSIAAVIEQRGALQ
jgi:hypothetical protein